MIDLPDFSNAFDYENNFYLSCDGTRISKILAHYELFKMSLDVAGDIVECGVFKGASFARFAMFRQLFELEAEKKLIGFDVFGVFPETTHAEDITKREKFIKDAGIEGIGLDQLKSVLKAKSVEKNVDLVKGDIVETVPEYVANNPDLKISLLNLDTDIYEPAVVILEELFPRIVSGGILIIDDYNVFPGETKAVDDFFSGREAKIERFAFAKTPHYIVKK